MTVKVGAYVQPKGLVGRSIANVGRVVGIRIRRAGPSATVLWHGQTEPSEDPVGDLEVVPEALAAVASLRGLRLLRGRP